MTNVQTSKPEVVRLPDGRTITKAEFDSGPEKGKCVCVGRPIEEEDRMVQIVAYGFEVPMERKRGT